MEEDGRQEAEAQDSPILLRGSFTGHGGTGAGHGAPPFISIGPVPPAAGSVLAGEDREGLLLVDLDQVAAGVVEDRDLHGAHVRWLLVEPDAEVAQPLELRLDVVDAE